jgi:hypothetical protein
MLDAVNQARDAIKQNNLQAALDPVNRAIGLQQALDREGQKGRAVPIYTEVVRMSISNPSEVAGHGQIAHLGTPSEKMDIYAGKNQESTADRMTTVEEPATAQNVSGAFTRVSLDTNVTETHLPAAREALNRGDLNGADKDLSAAQDAMATETVAADLPLLRARENLALAARETQRDDYNTAAASVRAAVDALASYAEHGGPKAGDARTVGRHMQSLAERIPPDRAQAASEIEKFWNQVAELQAR